MNLFKTTLAAAAMVLAPLAASAITLTVDDLGTVGVDQTVIGTTNVSFSGTAGGFEVSTATGNISQALNNYRLNSTSIETSGIGQLQITVQEDGLTSPLQYSNLNLTGTASISEIGKSVTVEHFIKFGAGTFQQIGSTLAFDVSGGQFQSAGTTDIFGNTEPYSLKSIITITSDNVNSASNVNATLIAAVPVPAAGLLLLTAIGGAAALRRRKKAVVA